MQRKYNVDIKQIEDIRDILLEYYPSNEDEISRVNMLLDKMKNEFSDERDESTLASLRDDSSYLDDMRDLYRIVRTFISNGMICDGVCTPYYNELKLSDQDCMDLAGDFFLEQGKFFSKKFDEFYEDAESHLKFVPDNDSMAGQMHFFPSVGEGFIFVVDYNNFTKASVLIHELEHVIDAFNNPEFYDNLLIRECSAIFMEMIGVHFLGDKLKLTDAPYMRRFSLHTIVKSDGYNLYYKNQLLYLVKQNIKLSDKKLRNLLCGKYKISSDFIDFSNRYHLVEDYYYQLSQLIAIELFAIYKVDKEKALYILKDIIMNGNDENIFSILKKYNIVLNDNVVAYEDELSLKLGL